MNYNQPSNSFTSGAGYLIQGARLLSNKQLRPYILVPILVNCALFVVLSSFLLSYFWNLVESGNTLIPEWLHPWVAPFAWFVWFLVGVLFLIVYAYSFNFITNFIAAPFYGKLSEVTQKLISGEDIPDESIGRMLLRVFSRECSKLFYFLGRGCLIVLVMILVMFIPFVNSLAPLIGLFWGAWSMAIQYTDYPADNHQVPFPTMRNLLWRRSRSSLGFGGAVIGCSIIPLVNILAMPAAVIGGTIYWLNELQEVQSTTDETSKT